MGSALPARLMVVAFLGIAIVAAAAVAMRTARLWRIASGIALVAGLATIAPALPYPSAAASVPAFFKPGGGVERLARGSVLIVTPFSSKQSTDAMLWQAVANYRFRMPEGDAFTPGPYLGPHPTFMQSVFDGLDAGKTVTVTPEVRAKFVADLERSRVSGGIVVGPSPGRSAIVAFLTQIEGSPPIEDGGVEVWWLNSIT
jgi:hypothetical protein